MRFGFTGRHTITVSVDVENVLFYGFRVCAGFEEYPSAGDASYVIALQEAGLGTHLVRGLPGLRSAARKLLDNALRQMVSVAVGRIFGGTCLLPA